MAKLVCQAGPHAGHEYALREGRIIFGRQSTCDAQILDKMASREHFAVRMQQGLYSVIDLESRNGTRLNGRKVTERQLDFGDRIAVGDVEYVFVKEEGDLELRDLLTSKYEIIDKLGEGGMGIVYRARQRSMDREVALKILAPKYAARPRFIETFVQEARAAGRLNHPNIVQVHDVDAENGLHYFSMEFIDGCTAMDLVRNQGPMSPRQALEVTRLTAKALEYAHDHHLIHRDVKPDNIMLAGDGLVKLADLGIAKTFEEAEAEGKPKRIVGTPHYMAPEAAAGEAIDHRLDIYSLGATLYHLLAGKTPHSGGSATEVLKAHIKQDPPPIEQFVPGIEPAIRRLLSDMLARRPDERISNMSDVIAAIERIQRDCDLQAERSGGETVMLRRFASGQTTDGGDSTTSGNQPRPSTTKQAVPGTKTGTGTGTGTGSGTRDGDQARGATRRGATRRQAKRSSPLVPLVVIAAAGIAAAIMWKPAMRFLQAQGLIGSPPEPEPTVDLEAEARARAEAEAAAAAQAQAAALHARLERELRQIEQQVATATNQAEVEAARTAIAELTSQLTDADHLQRISRVNQQLADTIAEWQSNSRARRLEQLRSEVSDYTREHDYEAALRRCQSVRAQEPALADAIATIEAEIREEQEAYFSTRREIADRLIARGDREGLEAFYQRLPEALRNSDLGRDVTAAINAAERAEFEAHRIITEEASALYHEWRFSELERHLNRYAERVSGAPAEAPLNAMRDHMATLRGMISTLNQTLTEAERKPRYPRTLRGIPQPDLVGATDIGIAVDPSGGDHVVLPWRTLTAEERIAIVDQVLGADGARWHQALAHIAAPAGE